MTCPMHHQVWLSCLVVALGLMSAISPCEGGRYRLCQDGCCIHEYCAYDHICYPRIHCHFGCPDGYCTGTGNTNRDQQPKRNQQQQYVRAASSMTKRNSPNSRRSGGLSDQIITENYSHSDNNVNEGMSRRVDDTDKTRGKTDIPLSVPPENSQNSPEGICMPLPPCKRNDPCGMGHSCSYNFNLGYSVCQYNLDIGTTLCYDTHGNFVAKPTH